MSVGFLYKNFLNSKTHKRYRNTYRKTGSIMGKFHEVCVR